MTSGTEASARDPVVVCCADEAYALPLAVTVRSALDHLDPSRVLDLYVVDAGITPRKQLAEALALMEPSKVVGVVLNGDDAKPYCGDYYNA